MPLPLAGAGLVAAFAACPPADGPGRVKCTVEIRASGGRIAWADAVIASAPAFVVALRGRLSPGDATETRDDRWKLEFAVVAKSRGKGELVLRVRAIVCERDACHPEEREARATITVGE